MLTSKNELRADLDDLVFENRNKVYGAYQLRKTYDERLAAALFAPASLFILFFCLLWLPNSKTTNEGYAGPLCELPMGTIEVERIQFMDQEKTVDEKVVPVAVDKPVRKPDPEPKQNENQSGAIGGDPFGNSGEGTGSGNGTGTGTDFVPVDSLPKKIIVKKKEEPVQEIADVLPKFDGYNEFVTNHLNYPQAAIENHVEGMVVVRFVVDEKGKVSDLEVMKGLPMGCTEAALETLRKMPEWTPGQTGGHAVKVRTTAVIKFELNK